MVLTPSKVRVSIAIGGQTTKKQKDVNPDSFADDTAMETETTIWGPFYGFATLHELDINTIPFVVRHRFFESKITD
eukprot:jgi/Bigna1/136162/aug1.32_g10870